MASRITAAIAGDKTQREAAYAALTALAHGDNADVAAIIASASVHIGGLEPLHDAAGIDDAGKLRDEAKLAELFGQVGTVLAVTLTSGSTAALLTFSEAAEAQKAVDDGVVSLGAAGSGLFVRALGTQEALGGVGDMSEAVCEHQGRVAASVAALCVGPF